MQSEASDRNQWADRPGRIRPEAEIRAHFFRFPEVRVRNPYLRGFPNAIVADLTGVLKMVDDGRDPMLRRGVARQQIEKQEQ